MKKLFILSAILFSLSISLHAIVYPYILLSHSHRNNGSYEYLIDCNNAHECLNTDFFYYDEPRMWPLSIFLKEPIHYRILYHSCEEGYHVYMYEKFGNEFVRVGVRQMRNHPKDQFSKRGEIIEK